MKLSNKVLLGFLGVIFLYITAAFTELRLTGTPYTLDEKNSVTETVDLSSVAHVTIDGLDHYVWIRGSDSARLEVRSAQGGFLKNLTYKISGDTLVMSDFQHDGKQRVDITVFVQRSALRQVAVNGSSASIEGLDQDILRVSQNDGRISMSNNKIGKMDIDATSNSFLTISDSKLDTLSATVDGSQVHVRASVGFVKGSISNHARMQLNQMQEIQLKEDESSKLTVYQ